LALCTTDEGILWADTALMSAEDDVTVDVDGTADLDHGAEPQRSVDRRRRGGRGPAGKHIMSRVVTIYDWHGHR
jgi:hypothetical protein